MLTRQDAAALAAQLRAERAAVQSFLDVLKREQEALVRGEDDRIDAEVETKSRLLASLSQFAEERGRWLAAHAHSADRTGMESWLAGRAGATTLLKEWQELIRLTRNAYQANRTNGILIDMRLRANQRARAALASAARVTSLYGPDGRARSPFGSRPLGTV